MKRVVMMVISFMSIIGIGLVIQANSSYFYSEPVMKIDEATIVGDSQIITGHLINESSDEKIELEEVFYKTEPITPKYHQGEQLILKRVGMGWQVSSLKRDGYVFILLGLFAWTVLAVGGKKGITSLIGVICNSVLLIALLAVNQHNRSYSLIALMSVYAILAVLIAFGLSYGIKRIDIRKITATLCSVFLAFLICVIAMSFLDDSGLHFEQMSYITRAYRAVFLGSLLIGALGASMDNVVVIISSLDEIKKKNKDLDSKALVASGKKIAQDTSSSMINVLLFAYLSGTLPVFVFYLANGWEFGQSIGLFLSLEILRTICGAFAIVLSIPISLLIFSLTDKWMSEKKAGR